MPRQTLPPVYMPNGAIYIVKASNFLKNPKFWTKRTIPFVMEKDRSVDIDTLSDITFVKKYLSKNSI